MGLYDINGNAIVAGGGESSVLSGKKWAVCGDSITSGEHSEKDENGNYKTYDWFIAKRNNMTLYRDGISGTKMSNTGNSHDFSVNRYKNIPSDCDYITLWFGINDGAEFGTIDDTENTTQYGAYNVVISYLIYNHPNAKIGLIVSHDIGTKADVIRNIAKKYGLGIFDIQGDVKIPFWADWKHERTYVDKEIADFRMANWLADGQHPNVEGYRQISTSMEAWMRTL